MLEGDFKAIMSPPYTLVDHFVGTIDRANVRLLYVIVGLALMFASCCWIRSLVQAPHRDDGQNVSETSSATIRIKYT